MNTVTFAGAQGHSKSSPNRNGAGSSSLKQQTSWPKTTPSRKLSTSRASSPYRKEDHYQNMLASYPTPSLFIRDIPGPNSSSSASPSGASSPRISILQSQHRHMQGPLSADHLEGHVKMRSAFLDDRQHVVRTRVRSEDGRRFHYSSERSAGSLCPKSSVVVDQSLNESPVTPFLVQYGGSNNTTMDHSSSSAAPTHVTGPMADGLLEVANAHQHDIQQHSFHAYHIDGRLGNIGAKKSDASPLPSLVGCPTFQHPGLSRDSTAEPHRWDKKQHQQQQISPKVARGSTMNDHFSQPSIHYHNQRQDGHKSHGHAPFQQSNTPHSTGHPPCGMYSEKPQHQHQNRQHHSDQQHHHYQVQPPCQYPFNHCTESISGTRLHSRSSRTFTPQPFLFEQKHFNFQTQELTSVKPRPFQLTDFTVKRTIGTGSCGRVLLVQSVFNSRFYALKVLKKRQVVQSNQIEHVNEEKRILQRIRHPFLVKTWGTFQDSANLYIVMDYVVGGELFSVLRRMQVIISTQ